MFYTKYRPQKFSEISRPNEAADALVAQIQKGKSVHAYLFVGSRGTGKTTTARILAKALNCEHLSSDGDPCDKCPSCTGITNGSFLDLIEIDAASNRGIDDIRELKNKIKLAPVHGKIKIYIIDEVHMLTNEAFNALLKTLEEPPSNTTFILCTTEVNKVPDTIKSRCQVFKFKRAGIGQLVSKLKTIAKNEKIKISDEDLTKIAKASLGGFRDAETLLEQVSDGNMGIDAFLNLGSKENILEFIELLVVPDISGALKASNKLFEDGIDMYVWMGELIRLLRDMMFIASGAIPAGFDLPDELEERTKKFSNKVELSWLVKAIEILSKNQSMVKSSYVSSLPLELAVIEICGYADEDDKNLRGNKKGGGDQDKANLNKIKESISDPEEKLVEILTEQQEDENLKVDKDEKKESKSKKESTDTAVITLPIEIVKERWSQVITSMADLNASLMALLKSASLVDTEGKFIILEVYYSFHKERLESPKNRVLIEKLLAEVYDLEIKLKCKLSESKPAKLNKKETGLLTDYNIVPAQSQVAFDKGAVIEMLDGGLPLM